jgi:hypothetical protein
VAKNNHASSLARQCLCAATMVAVLACGLIATDASQAAEIRRDQDQHLRPSGKGFGEHDPSGLTEKHANKFAKVSTNGINYHGGPLMLGTVNLYYIWYGTWDDSSKTILSDLASSMGAAPNGTPYFNINTTYYDAAKNFVSGNVAFAGSTTDAYSQGAALSDAGVANVVTNAISGGKLPYDVNGVYFVLTSKDVNETSGFCTVYCAWHSYGSLSSSAPNVKFGFVGNPERCPSACSAQSVSPNGNLGADGMANLIAHELAESVTDPHLDAWFDRRGYENADKCAWKFGTTTTLSTGAKYNVSFGGRNWLLQQNWLNASGGKCTLAN